MCCAPSILVRFNFGSQRLSERGTREIRNLSQAGRGTEGIQVDIRTAELQGNLRFKYETLVAEFGIVGNADYKKAVTKILTTRTKYQFGVRNVAVYRKSGY